MNKNQEGTYPCCDTSHKQGKKCPIHEMNKNQEELERIILETFKFEGDKDATEVFKEVDKHGLMDINSWDNKEAGFFDMTDYAKKIASAILSAGYIRLSDVEKKK